MDNIKPIISNQEGQNLFPGLPTFIKGNKKSTPITMKNTSPQIGLTPYGASYMMPDEDYNFAGDGVLEIPVAQAGGIQGGGEEELQQILMMYAQMKGMKPEELMQKLQSLPEKQQQQAIQAIAQEVQQVMAQQQPQANQPQQEGMMEQQQEMGMARYGGKACIDCEEQFPQAQNLNWFYKMHGGEAFPQANKYPEDWANYSGTQYAQGGEAFPQAQTYLPYNKGSKPAPNFMFQQGGTLYDYVKSMGLDPSYKSRKKLFSKYFDEPYTGTAEQNIYLLQILKNIGKAEKPKLQSVGFPKSQSSFNNEEIAASKAKSYASERSVLPRAKQAQKEADQRQIPQTGVVVDKRTGEAVVIGPTQANIFPVLTGVNIEGNLSPNTLNDKTFKYKATPTGYYEMAGINQNNQYLIKDDFQGKMGMWLNPIDAYGVDAPIAVNLGIHSTYDPIVRTPLYTAPAEQRNVSSGCVNCRPDDYVQMMNTLGGPDTVMVVDTKNLKDKKIFDLAKKQAIDFKNPYSVMTTEPKNSNSAYEYGGSTDIDQIYKIMKANGFDMNPKKKKGGAFSKETFNEYVMRNGGNLPMHQINGQANFSNQGGIGEFYKQQKPTQSFKSPYDEFSFSDEYKNEVANFNKAKKEFAGYNQNSQQKRRDVEARKVAELKKALSYNVGKGSVNMFGPKTSAVFGLLGMGADAAKGFSGGYLYDELPKPNSDDIQYQPCFPGMPCFHEEGQGSDNTLNQGNLNLSQANNLSSQGSLGMWQYGGANTSAFNSGVFDQIAALREKQAYKKLYDKDTTTSGLFDLGAAEKTPQGAPIGTINYAGYNTYNTGDQNFGYGNYPSQYLNNFRYGGNILDQYEDGTEVEIPDDQLEDFVNAIYAAGGSVDFI